MDLYRFEAKAGQQWVFEIDAAQSKSPLDSKLEILTADGQPVQRMVLQAVRDSYVTFRGLDSTSRDCRLHNWEEMKLNEYLYLSGEIVKLFLAPRGPDSGFSFYPHEGSLFRADSDTTPTSHPVNEPLPRRSPWVSRWFRTVCRSFRFTLRDDDGLRKLGSDSRLTFTAPADGSYLARVTDVRGFQGADYKYTLKIRPSRPNFEVTLTGAAPTINLGSGKEFSCPSRQSPGRI